MKRNQQGFTLIELVITMAIVAILSIVATNSYKTQMQKSRRTEAKNMLYEIMQREERYISENNTYVVALTSLGYSAATMLTDGGFYKVTATANANGIADGVILTAVPQGVQAQDTACASLILNSNGQKTSSTGSTTCW